jgi:hypothetical protein
MKNLLSHSKPFLRNAFQAAVVLEAARLEHKERDCDTDVAHGSLKILTSSI